MHQLGQEINFDNLQNSANWISLNECFCILARFTKAIVVRECDLTKNQYTDSKLGKGI